MELSTLIQVLLSFMTGAVTVLAALILRKVEGGSAKAMVSFQLHPERTVREFRVFFFGSCVMATGFIAHLIGGMTGTGVLLLFSQIGSLTFVAASAYVLFSWWRRF